MERYVIKGDALDEWLRTSFVSDQGEVFLPCGAFGDEIAALLSLAHDGASFVCDGAHIYAPTSWLARQHPRFADAIHAMAANIRRRLSTAEGMCLAS